MSDDELHVNRGTWVWWVLSACGMALFLVAVGFAGWSLATSSPSFFVGVALVWLGLIALAVAGGALVSLLDWWRVRRMWRRVDRRMSRERSREMAARGVRSAGGIRRV